MFASQNHRADFADTRVLGAESARGFGGPLGELDADPVAQAEAADQQLLQLVMCVATATLTLALLGSLAGL